MCRGCKRFAHEVVGWNGFEDSQRALVWQRLGQLLRESVAACIAIDDEARLGAAAASCNLTASADAAIELVAFDVLRQHLARNEDPLIAEFGLAPVGATTAACRAAEATQRIDREFHQRSLAHYERSYRVLAR